MPKLLIALLYGLAVGAALFFWSNPLLEWGGGPANAHYNMYLWAAVYGWLAIMAVFKPRHAAIIAAATVTLVLLTVFILGGLDVLGDPKMWLVVGAHGLPFVLPYLWSIGYFDLFRDRNQAA